MKYLKNSKQLTRWQVFRTSPKRGIVVFTNGANGDLLYESLIGAALDLGKEIIKKMKQHKLKLKDCLPPRSCSNGFLIDFTHRQMSFDNNYFFEIIDPYNSRHNKLLFERMGNEPQRLVVQSNSGSRKSNI